MDTKVDAKSSKRSNKRVREESEEDSDDSDSTGSLKEFVVEEGSSDESVVEEREDPETLKTEAERFVGEIKGTVLNGRVLRSRDPKSVEARKTKDEYYDRFGRAEEARLLEKFMKKDIIDYLLTLASEFREPYIATGAIWPVLTMKMSLETIQKEYEKVKVFANLPESDLEDDEEENDDSDDSDEEEESEESEESDEEESESDAEEDEKE